MDTFEEKLQFAIEFSQRNLQQLRRGDQQNLVDDLNGFFLPRESSTPLLIEPEILVGDADIDQLDALRKEVRVILDAIIRQRQYVHTERYSYREGKLSNDPDPKERSKNRHSGLTSTVYDDISAAAAGAEPSIPISVDLRFILGESTVSGTFRDCFLFTLSHLINGRADRIMQCSSCSLLFYQRDKRQQFCSRRCLNRDQVRKWREARSKEEQSESNHEKYKRKVQRKTGSGKIEVARQPRKRKKVNQTGK